MVPAPVGAPAAATPLVELPSDLHNTWVIVRPSTSPDPARYSPGWSAQLSEQLGLGGSSRHLVPYSCGAESAAATADQFAPVAPRLERPNDRLFGCSP